MIDLQSPHYWTPRPGCPRLFLAPMEGLNDRPWRKVYSQYVGGFDETSCEFIRMPKLGHAKSLAKAYSPLDTHPIPVAAQVMSEDPVACAAISFEVQERGAKRIDLNCGCPSNTVVGSGAGSSLLKSPQLIYEIVKAMCQACHVPITVKIRAGFEDDSLLSENLLAIESAGASFITLHPRTKIQGYSGQADWSLIKKAKSIVNIPIVASGDVTSCEKAKELHMLTHCDGIMIGRGAFIDPWIFWKTRAHFEGHRWEMDRHSQAEALRQLLENFLLEISFMTPRSQLGRIKQLVRFLQQGRPALQLQLKSLLIQDISPIAMIEQILNLWTQCENHFLSPPSQSHS